MKKLVVDECTGEILNELNEGDRIVRKKSLEYLANMNTWKIEHFYKGHIGEIRSILSELNRNERAFLFSIASYVGYEDCCLKHDNGNELKFSDLIKLSGMAKSLTSEVVNSLIKKDILYKGKNSKNIQYFINPWIFCKGQRINNVLKTMFKNYRVRVVNKKWKDIK